MGIRRQRCRCIARQVFESQTAGGMLVKRIQCQVLPIRGKRELLKINHRFEAANHSAVSGVPVELIKRGACWGAIDKHTILRGREFGSAEICWRGRDVACQQQGFTDLSHSFPVHTLREEILVLGKQQVIRNRYSTTLGSQQQCRISTIEGLSVDFRSWIVTGQACASQIYKMLAVRQKLNPHLAGFARKQRRRRGDSSISGGDAENRTIHCSGKENGAVQSPSTLCNFRYAVDHLRDSTRPLNLLQFGPRPKADEL